MTTNTTPQIIDTGDTIYGTKVYLVNDQRVAVLWDAAGGHLLLEPRVNAEGQISNLESRFVRTKAPKATSAESTIRRWERKVITEGLGLN